MNIQRLEQALHAYVARELLNGDGRGLTRSSPLFELGVLDSFAVLKLLTFVEREFGTAIPIEIVESDDVKDIASLAALVARRRAEGGPQHNIARRPGGP